MLESLLEERYQLKFHQRDAGNAGLCARRLTVLSVPAPEKPENSFRRIANEWFQPESQ